jgi:hypothetical protein
MDFFNSLTLDLKVLLIGIAGCALLALFSGSHKAEKRYLVLLAVLAATGVYRFTRVAGEDQAQRSAVTRSVPHTVSAPPKHKPLESTSAR